MPHLLVSYLEMRRPPAGNEMKPPLPSLAVAREQLERSAYLDLYDVAGGRVGWDVRKLMPAEELQRLLEGDDLRVYVLKAGNKRCGMCEFEMAEMPNVRLSNFGIAEELEGRGIGRYLLDVALRDLWRAGPDRVWLHTDEWDSPRAIPTYEQAGFSLFERRYEDVTDL